MATVLVVDDEHGNVEVLVHLLEAEGYRAIGVGNGREALEAIGRERPDLVVTDFMMPILDGAKLVAAVRAHPEHGRMPIVMTSALDETAIAKRVQGYDAFLRKPYDAEQLLQVIRALVDARDEPPHRPRPQPSPAPESAPDPQIADLLQRFVPKPPPA